MIGPHTEPDFADDPAYMSRLRALRRADAKIRRHLASPRKSAQ